MGILESVTRLQYQKLLRSAKPHSLAMYVLLTIDYSIMILLLPDFHFF